MSKSTRYKVPVRRPQRATPTRPNPIRVSPIGSNFIETSDYDDPRSYGRHGGIDLAPTVETPVPAIAVGDGRVIGTNTRNDYGNFVDVQLNSGEIARYAHLDSFAVRPGDTVQAGDPLGVVGSTGQSSGTHLHFELRSGLLHGQTIDPQQWLSQLLNGREPAARQHSTRSYVPNSSTSTQRQQVVRQTKPAPRYRVPVQVQQDNPFWGSDLIRINPITPAEMTPAQTVGTTGVEYLQQEITNAYLSDEKSGIGSTTSLGAQLGSSDPLGLQATWEGIKTDVSEGIEQNIGYVAVAILAIIVAAVAIFGLVK